VRGGQFAYNPSRLNVGSLAYLKEFEAGLLSPMYVVFEALSELDSDFLGCWLTSGRTKNLIKASTQGTVRDSVNFSALSAFPIDFPPYSEQQKIAAILGSVDKAIEKTRTVIDQTRRLKKAMMQELLTRGISGRHKSFKKTPVGEIPEEWKVVRVGSIGRVQMGRQRAPKYQKGTSLKPYLRVANVFDGYIDFSDVLMMDFNAQDLEQYRLQDGDILLNEGQSRELVGRCAIYASGPKDCCFQNTLIRFQASSEILRKFAHVYFQYCFYTGRFSIISVQTTSVAHLGASRFSSMKMPLPSLKEQKEISTAIEQSEKYLERLEKHQQQLSTFKTVLLQMLLTGEVRVKT